MGGPVGSWFNKPRDVHTPPYKRLHDYRMEHIMLGGTENLASGAPATGLPRWRQQVQYAVGHTLNDFYSLLPEVRRETPIQFLLERRWPPRGDAFPSLLQYWDIKTSVADELMRIVSSNHLQEIPVMLYEQWHVPVPALNLELSMITQLAWNSSKSGRSVNIQKFMVNGNEDIITGFMHMANVFAIMLMVSQRRPWKFSRCWMDVNTALLERQSRLWSHWIMCVCYPYFLSVKC